MTDPVTAYARGVVDGTIIASRLVRLAGARHLRDLETGAARGLRWDVAEVDRAIAFFADILCLPEDTQDPDPEAPLEGTPFRLQPWQQFIVGSLLGWWTTAGTRRYRDAFIETAKGCGKTPLGAGLMLYLLIADGERGAQVYMAAVSKDQAKLAFTDADKMVASSPYLRVLVDRKVNNLAILETGSYLRPISSEKRGLDGKRVHGALIDEEHEHRTDVVVSKVRRGTKGRRNALVVRTTNSGVDRQSICWHDHDHSRKVLEGATVDDAWFAFVCGLDPCPTCLDAGKEFPAEDCKTCDDWRVEGAHWTKACPNLGVSVSWQYYRELVTQALARPDAVSDLLRFNFCVWTTAQSRPINLQRWQACQARPADAALAGRPCVGGLDLGQSDDLSAWVRVWELDGGAVAVKCRFWLPSVALERYRDRPYEEWRRAGALTVTEGDTTDYDLIEATVAADCDADGVREVAYDRRFAEQLAQHLLGRGITMVNTPQGFQLNEAIRKKLELVTTGQLCHGGDPILTWMASNYVLRHGTKREVRPDKDHAADKIDGQVALDMALDRIVRRPVDPPKPYQLFVLGRPHV